MGLKTFVGREKELELLLDTITRPDSNKAICFVHDATTEQEEKGGIGKTSLLRALLERLQQKQTPSSPFVVLPQIVDLYEMHNRDRIAALANLIEQLERQAREVGIEHADRAMREFNRALSEYREVLDARAEPTTLQYLSGAVNDAFAQALKNFYELTQRRVICFLDSFEYIEND